MPIASNNAMIVPPARPGLWASFTRLYRAEQVFRGGVDLAVIGAIVYLFIEPGRALN